MPSASSVSAAWRIVSQSDWLPMMIPTSAIARPRRRDPVRPDHSLPCCRMSGRLNRRSRGRQFIRRMLTLLSQTGDMSKHSWDFVPAAPASLVDENELLRASLGEAQRRIETLEQSGGDDPVTGLPGRRRLVEEVERVTGLARRYGTPAALLTIDPKGLAA